MYDVHDKHTLRRGQESATLVRESVTLNMEAKHTLRRGQESATGTALGASVTPTNIPYAEDDNLRRPDQRRQVARRHITIPAQRTTICD